MTNTIHNYINSFEAYTKFKRNHVIGAAIGVILSIALGALSHYVLSHGLISQLQQLNLAQRISLSVMSGYISASIGIVSVLASFILRADKKQSKLSNEALLQSLKSPIQFDQSTLLKLKKIMSDKNRLIAFLEYVDDQFFTGPLIEIKNESGEIIREGDIQVHTSLKTGIADNIRQIVTVEQLSKAKEQLSSELRSALNIEGESLIAFDKYDKKIEKFLSEYRAEHRNRQLHLYSWLLLPCLLTVAIGIIGASGGIFPQSGIAVNAACVASGSYVLLSTGTIAILLNYVRTQKEKKDLIGPEAFLSLLSTKGSWKKIVRSKLEGHPLNIDYKGMLTYIDNCYFTTQYRDSTEDQYAIAEIPQIIVNDTVKGRALEILFRNDPLSFIKAYNELNISLELRTYIEHKMIQEYIFDNYVTDNTLHLNGLRFIQNFIAIPSIRDVLQGTDTENLEVNKKQYIEFVKRIIEEREL